MASRSCCTSRGCDLATLIAWRVALEVVRLLALGPVDASIAATRLLGAPGWTSEVLDLVRAESRGEPVGIHRRHARRVPGRAFWRRAVAAGVVSPGRCIDHQLDAKPTCKGCLQVAGERWGIRGAHGLAAAYSVSYLGECAAPELLDVPLLSALVVVRRLEVLERRYGLTTRQARAEAWRRGPGRRARPAVAAATSGGPAPAAGSATAQAPRPAPAPR